MDDGDEQQVEEQLEPRNLPATRLAIDLATLDPLSDKRRPNEVSQSKHLLRLADLVVVDQMGFGAEPRESGRVFRGMWTGARRAGVAGW